MFPYIMKISTRWVTLLLPLGKKERAIIWRLLVTLTAMRENADRAPRKSLLSPLYLLLGYISLQFINFNSYRPSPRLLLGKKERAII